MYYNYALIRLFVNAIFLPFAFFIDWFQSKRPTESSYSGAEEGGHVTYLEQEGMLSDSNVSEVDYE